VTDLSDTQLHELCAALGWQGGTYHQVLAEVQQAHRLATQLACSLARKFYEAPQWKPLPDLVGVISQIDNMTTDLTRTHTQPAAQPDPVGWQERQQRSAAEWTPWYACPTPLPGAPRSSTVGGVIYEWRPIYAAAPPPAAQSDEALGVLRGAREWISRAPHGDNCFVSDNYEGDPGDRCNCGRDNLADAIDAAIKGA
jgi:hypothetical protein